MPEAEEEATPEEIIICPVTRWYFRRIAMVSALFAGLALFFWYDGAIGYPKTNLHADLFDAFEAGKSGDNLDSFNQTHPELVLRNLRSDHRSALESAIDAGASGGSWAAFAAERHLGEVRPERHSASAIRQQFVFAWVLGILAIGTGIFALVQRKRCLRAGSGWLEAADGNRVEFSRITGGDFSKWDRGIAFLEATGENGRKTRIRVDDYKFSGVGEILKKIAEARPEIKTECWPDLSE